MVGLGGPLKSTEILAVPANQTNNKELTKELVMGKFIDITGIRFGSLVAVRRAKDGNRKQVKFECICDCGKVVNVCSSHLRGGTSESCGCKREEYYRSKKIDLVGEKFFRLTVLRRVESDKNGNSRWECLCKCGLKSIVYGSSLKNFITKSCGCYAKDPSSKANLTHGMTKTRTWRVWSGMKTRCDNKNNDNYKYYGGRGITYCERWESFGNFYKDMGERPYGMTLDRINVNGNYEPGNVKWSSPKEQANNRRRNHFISYKGETKTLTEWSRKLGISTRGLTMRINKWGIEEAFTRPKPIQIRERI